MKTALWLKSLCKSIMVRQVYIWKIKLTQIGWIIKNVLTTNVTAFYDKGLNSSKFILDENDQISDEATTPGTVVRRYFVKILQNWLERVCEFLWVLRSF